MPNQFYVAPLGGLDVGQRVADVGRSYLKNKRETEAAEREKEGLRMAEEAYKSGDPDQVAMVSLQYPELAAQLSSSVGFKNETTRQNMIASLRSGVADPSRIPELIQKRADLVKRQGGDPTETLAELERYSADPEGYARRLEQSLALMDPEGYKAYREATVEPQTRYTNVKPTEDGGFAGLNMATGQYERIPTGGISFKDTTPSTTVNVNTADNAFNKEFGKVNAQEFFVRRQAAADAASSLEGISEARKLLDSGIIAGAGAEFIVGLGKGLQRAGINFAEDEVANSEAFIAAQAKQVANIIKAFGAGTGLSDADREFAEKAAGGKITMTEKSIRRILDINEKASRNVLKRFNKEAAQIDPQLSPFPLGIEAPTLEASDIDALVNKYAE